MTSLSLIVSRPIALACLLHQAKLRSNNGGRNDRCTKDAGQIEYHRSPPTSKSMKSPILLSLLLLSSSSATKGAFTAAFISPFCNAPPPSSQRLSAHKCKEQQHQGTSSFDLETTRRAALQILSSVPILTSAAAASPASALELKSAVLPIPPQARETSWPLGKVAFSLLPLAGSYSRRATGERCMVSS